MRRDYIVGGVISARPANWLAGEAARWEMIAIIKVNKEKESCSPAVITTGRHGWSLPIEILRSARKISSYLLAPHR